jgi:hypothetical protein
MLQGKTVGDTFIVMDTFALPVEAGAYTRPLLARLSRITQSAVFRPLCDELRPTHLLKVPNVSH